MSSAINLIPSNIPIDEAGNIMNPVWYLFFQQLYSRSGGAVSQSNNELIVGQLDDAGIEESKLEIYALRDQVMSLAAQIQSVIDDLNNAPVSSYGYDYNPASVVITGGAIDGSTIGSTTPSTGRFTNIINGNAASLIQTSVSLTNGAAAAAGTLTNAPVAGNPTKWAPVNDNGTIRYSPLW